ncbi:unnamed protein product [Arctogadus glacialis]
MSTSSGGPPPLDHGVQIRFIKDLPDARGGGVPGPQPRTKPRPASKYGVAVRVQGIAGLPYVVLKDGGEKGDSYGVQLKTHYPPGYGSLPRRREKAEVGEQGGEVMYGGGGGGGGGALRRAQSHGSLLDRDGEEPGGGEEFQLRRPPGDGRSGSYGNLDGGLVVGREREGARGGAVREADQNGRYQNGSLDGTRGVQVRPNPPPPAPPPQTTELNSGQRRITPVNRLINRFDGRGGGAGAGGAEQQRVYSPRPEDPREASPVLTPNPYSSRPSSTDSSLGRNQSSASSGPHQWSPTGRAVAVDNNNSAPIHNSEKHVTPDLLLDQGQVVNEEEEQLMQTLYSILRDGTSESEVAIRQKVQVIFQKVQSLRSRDGSGAEWRKEKRELERSLGDLQAALKEERRGSSGRPDPALREQLESSLDENIQLQEMLGRKNKEFHQTQSELIQLRMERENAETRVRDVEDQLAGLQDELRESSRTELAGFQAQLAEASQLKQRLEEGLRQRERELTALKGVLKDEVASHDRDMESLREQYSTDMEKLRGSMEQVSQSQAGIEAERLRVNSSVRSLQQQLEDCRDESSHWMEQFHTTKDELRTTRQELLKVRLDKEEFEEELKELQGRVSSMKQQIPDPSHAESLSKELSSSRSNLLKVQSEVEKHRTDMDRKVMEVISLKKAHQEQEAELKYEIDRLKEQLKKAKEEFAKEQQRSKKLPDPSVVSEMEQKLGEAKGEGTRLQEKLSLVEAELQSSKTCLCRARTELADLRDSEKEQEEASKRIRDKILRLEAQLQSSTSESSELEVALHSEIRGLKSELDEAKRKASRLGQETIELRQSLEVREREKEALAQSHSQLEEARLQQEKALEKLLNEHESVQGSSREEVQILRAQLEEQREKTRKETQEAHRHGNDAQDDLERSQASLRRLEEEMSRQKKELLLACEERDNHQLDRELLTNRLRHLEGELENSKNSHSEKSRENRLLEDKMKRLELELEEEKGNAEMLMDRVNRSRDQIDTLRSELLQERSSKQDLELDKTTMERHLKELKSRLADMEGQSRSSAGVSQLELQVQELEERLRSEDREKNSMVASQRRLERKLKELSMAQDEERQQHTDQRDQLTLRVKALKRQVDEGETEVERVDGLRRKAQREMEEQLEQKDALQTRIKALETELKRKTQAVRRQALDSSALSSEDDDDDSLYDPSGITSYLTESNLQTSSC